MKRPYAAVLILVVLVAVIAQGACLPHTHSGVGVGLYNGEHDLTLLATASSAAPLPIPALLHVVVVTAPVVLTMPSTPASVVTRDAESRAPPAA